MTERGSDILAFTVTYGSRDRMQKTVPNIRATAGCWFDWAWYLGNPSSSLLSSAQTFLKDPGGRGIQHLVCWPQNRGQHHAFKAALALAREREYKWLLRLDDDVIPRRKFWLQHMVERLEDLKTRKGDEFYRLIAAPRIVGLQNPLEHQGILDAGQSYPVEVMSILGGACRLHPVELLEEFEPNLYDPLGRGDPEAIAHYVETRTGGFLIRFPDIKLRHPTKELEKKDSEAESLQRRMGRYWCYLGAGV